MGYRWQSCKKAQMLMMLQERSKPPVGRRP